MDFDLFTDALGPVWSNNGTKTWSILLAPDRIIAWPYTFVRDNVFDRESDHPVVAVALAF